MDHRSTALAIFLMSHYGILSAKVVDFHPRTAEEEHMIESVQEQAEIEEARETFNDEEATPEEQYDAFETLVEKEELV